MFEDILEGLTDLEDDLEKMPDPSIELPDPGGVTLDSNDWDTGEGDAWDTDQRTPGDDTIWRA
jgi:hypothetical protein